MTDDTMTAIEVKGGKGPAEALEAVRIARPTPAAGQILIAVIVSSVIRRPREILRDRPRGLR